MNSAAPGASAVPDDLAQLVTGARAEIERAIEVSGLKRDPLVPLMRALSLSLGVQHRLHDASTTHLRDVSDRLDRQVADAVTLAERELVAREAAVIGGLAPKLAVTAERAVRARLWTVKFRTLAASAGGAMVLMLVTLGAGYSLGYTAGRDAGLRSTASIVSAAERDGPDAAVLWGQLMANNDPRTAMTACQRTVAQQDGRRACLLPIWLDAAAPPARQ